MEEIYWLQRIGALSQVFSIMWIFAISVIGTFLLVAPVAIDAIEENELTDQAKKVAKALVVIFFIGAIGDIVTPTTKEMYAIYGIGGTIDYIKSNDNAKKLPDKVIDALDKCLDEFNNYKKDK